ncbi:hypothetical protein E2C01_009850 [Portunus trituberculatus]|uniref:Uncharacterized protein n=1 Tax=Portunus trituberculatus TaxID=210409 RepID=A0A5B7D6V6_PORTR|nr:hypothetical protein [Portunus trituberculatus]
MFTVAAFTHLSVPTPESLVAVHCGEDVKCQGCQGIHHTRPSSHPYPPPLPAQPRPAEDAPICQGERRYRPAAAAPQPRASRLGLEDTLVFATASLHCLP